MKSIGRLILTFVSIGIALGYLSFTRPNLNQKETTWEEVLIDAQKGGYKIITTEQLQELYKGNMLEKLLLVDTRQDWEYRTGHIKGAINFPMEPTWWARWQKAGELKTLLGPDKDRPIVFY
jgi:predicted sulfurtransferase